MCVLPLKEFQRKPIDIDIYFADSNASDDDDDDNRRNRSKADECWLYI